MANRPGHLWALIQKWLDATPEAYAKPSQNKLAEDLRVSPSALGDYKYANHMPRASFMRRLAVHIEVPYETVLDAALKDHGYREAKGVEGQLAELGEDDVKDAEEYLAGKRRKQAASSSRRPRQTG